MTVPDGVAVSQSFGARARVDRRRRILDAAAAVLVRDRGASLQDIAAAAGVGRTTVHRLFATREDLVRALAHESLAEAEAVLRVARPDQGPVRSALERLAAAFVPLGDRFEFLQGETRLTEDPVLREAVAPLEQALEDLMERGRADGTLRPDLPASWMARVLAALLFAAWDGVREGTVAPRAAAGWVVTTVVDGLGAGAPVPDAGERR